VSLTRINGEPVKLVESFEELKEGMVVWTKPCGWCGGQHRRMLLSLGRHPVALPTADGGWTAISVQDRFIAAPDRPCLPGVYDRDSVTRINVEGRRDTYRVTDERLESESQAKSRELERVR
jgi:hypothetical protein